MPTYTIIGWRSATRCGSVDYADAGAALAATGHVAARMGRDWQFVAAIVGRHRTAALWQDKDLTTVRAPQRPATPYTGVGFWRASGETLLRTEKAGDGQEALKLLQARLGGVAELQLIATFPEALEASLTAENLPHDYFW